MISINDKSVTGLRHSQVVEVLKDVAKREVNIKIVVTEVRFTVKFIICENIFT